MKYFQKNKKSELKTKRAQAGFSLIELMVVIVILGVLGTTAVIVFRGGADDARFTRAATEIKGMRDNIDTYLLKYGELPAELIDLEELKGVRIPENDPWGNPYEYYPGDGDSYEIRSAGKEEGNESDDVYYTPEEGVVLPSQEEE